MTGQEDFFEAKLSEDGTWNVSRELSEINTSGNEGAPTVRGDGRQLIFTACDGLDGRYGRRTGQGGCDLFYADLDVLENRFQRETNLEAVNSKGLGKPTFAECRRTMVVLCAGLPYTRRSCGARHLPIGASGRWYLEPTLATSSPALTHPVGRKIRYCTATARRSISRPMATRAWGDWIFLCPVGNQMVRGPRRKTLVSRSIPTAMKTACKYFPTAERRCLPPIATPQEILIYGNSNSRVMLLRLP